MEGGNMERVLHLMADKGASDVYLELTLDGAPDHMQNFRVISAEPKFERKKGLMFSIEASWIPALG